MRRRSKPYGFWAQAIIALLIPLQVLAVRVPDEYRPFIHNAEGHRKTWWQRICEGFDICEMSAADLSVALVVGVSKYKYLTPLESTRNDARELADFLLDSGEFEQVILLTEQDATKNVIEYFIEDYIPALLQDSAQAQPPSLLLLRSR
ncbi:MAG: caspase family protein [Gammaproteobacteria bacterium]|nr:caspase family protein [Gammaproteobacteria bacterium]